MCFEGYYTLAYSTYNKIFGPRAYFSPSLRLLVYAG